MWDIITVSTTVAHKAYHCFAAELITHSGLGKHDFDPEDWAVILAAKMQGYMILPGMKHRKATGRCERQFVTIRARLDLHDICVRYHLYDD